MSSCTMRTIQVTFDAQGGSAVEAASVQQLEAITEPVTTRTGYTFEGWYTDTTYITLFDFTTGATRNVTVYAKWKINSYTIEFEPDNDTEIDAITADYQATITIPTDILKEGYTFEGWYSDPYFNEKFESNRMVAENITLYANWEPIFYLVEFYIDDELLTTREVQHGDLIDDIPSLPAREGYDALWDLDADMPVEDDMRIDAVYQIKTYEVRFVDQWDHVYQTFYIDHGNKVSAPTETPTKTGYEFSGYSEDLDELIIVEDIDIEVIYTPITYLVTFRVQGSQVKNETVLHGTGATAPDVSVPGYVFNGWDTVFDNVTDDLDINAILTPIEYGIVLHGNGGLFADETNEYTILGDYQDSITYVGQPTRLGYTFAGWYLDAGATGNQVILTNYTMPLDGLDLYAKWEAVSYSIHYHDLFNTQNGNPLNYNITESFDLTEPTQRSGYNFLGWFDAENGGNEVSGITSGSTGDIDLYARWQTIVYTIAYENLEESTHQNPGTYTIESSTITLTNASQRAGYVFVGWFSEAEGGETITTISTGSMGHLTLHARWELEEYTVSYHNLEGSTQVNPGTYTIVSETITLTEPTARTGYVFSGWYTSLVGGDLISSIAQGTTGDLNVYAQWIAKIYLVSFDTGGGEPEEPMVVTFGQEFSLPLPLRDGYSFAGWTCNGQAFDDGFWDLDYDVVLSALWTQWPLISFVTNGGSAVQGISELPGTTITQPLDPSRNGYTFAGWYANINLTTAYTFDLMPAESLSVYAKWTLDVYTVTYANLEGMTHANPSTYTIESPTLTLTAPAARTGYTFVGWYTDMTGGNKIEQILNKTTGNLTLYARWTPVIYTIEFEIDGNSTYLYLPYMSTIGATDIPEIPAKANYDLTSPYWDEDPVNHMVTGGYVFTAVYVGNPLTVTYNTGGGSTMDPDVVAYGEMLSYPDVPTMSGYTFLAWYQDSELTVLYDFTSKLVQDMTLYAAWELDYYTWEIESIFLMENLDDPNIVTIDPGQGTVSFQYSNLYYGLEISPIQAYEGYVFDYFVYDGVEYSDIEQLIMVTGNRIGDNLIEVYYRKLILTITFAQDPDLFDPASEEAIVTFRVYYNDTFLIENAPDLRGESETVHVVWDRTQFVNVKNNLEVYALYYISGVKTVTFIDRGIIKYIASAIDELGNAITDVIGSDSILWDLYRPGYRFLGWFTAETGGDQVLQGDLLFESFVDVRTSLYARWEELTPFNTAVNISVNATETQIVISWDVFPVTVNGFPPAGFEFILNNQVISDLTTLPTLDNRTYTLTLNSTNPDFALFDDLLSPGYHQLSIRILGDEINNYHSEYSDNYTFSNESVFDGDPTEVAVYDYFIIETFGDTKRYIFYANLEYRFGSDYEFEIVSGQVFASAGGSTITTSDMPGSFKFRMIRDGYPTVVYDALVVHDIKQFTYGTNYQGYLQAIDPDDNVFLEEAAQYHVGSGNGYYLDLRIINNQGARIPLAQSVLDYELYELVLGNYELIPEDVIGDYLEFLPDNELQLQPITTGKTFKLVVQPRYQATKMTIAPLEFVFTVNDGVNVFNNQQLKEYFADFNVNTINIHASFKAELTSDQKNSDGSPINRRPTASSPTTGNVYQRFSTTIDDDSLVVEGNFMTIDGSELPFSNANSGSGTVGFAQSFEIVSVQIAVFFYEVKDASVAPTNNNQFDMNNLIIKGNTSTPYIDFSGTAEEIEIQERLMSKNSGGYGGIIASSGTFGFNNLYIFNAIIAVTNNAYGYNDEAVPTYVTLDYLKADNIWANTLYLHSGAGWIVKNSEIGQSGGAAIHMVDTRPAVFDEYGNKVDDPNPYLELQDSTVINNWISGEEAWFKAYGMSQVALTLKSGIQTGISPTGRSVIKMMTDPITGLETEKINFILLTEPSNGATAYLEPEEINQISGSEFELMLGEYQTQRAFDFLGSPDPRITNGQLAFPVGVYSDLNSFLALYQELAASVGEANAGDLATLGAFYGLSAQETLNTMGYAQGYSMTFKDALAYTVPEKVFPQYIEILAPVPVFTAGYSTVIIQFGE